MWIDNLKQYLKRRSRKYYYYWRLLDTHRRPRCLIRDRHVSSEIHHETDMRPTCLLGDRHATDMPPRRPTCLIGDPHLPDLTHRRPTCLIKHVQWVSNQTCRYPMRHVGLLSDMSRSPIRHVGYRLVSDQTRCRSPMGLRWVADINNIFMNSLKRSKIHVFNEICKCNYFAIFNTHFY